MQKNVEMWKVKTLLGYYPAKIEEYSRYQSRSEIVSLFETIFVVVYSNIIIDDVKNSLINSPYIVDDICKILFKRKEKKKKTRIVYEKNTILKWDIEEKQNEIIVRVPKQEF